MGNSLSTFAGLLRVHPLWFFTFEMMLVPFRSLRVRFRKWRMVASKTASGLEPELQSASDLLTSEGFGFVGINDGSLAPILSNAS